MIAVDQKSNASRLLLLGLRQSHLCTGYHDSLSCSRSITCRLCTYVHNLLCAIEVTAARSQ